MENEIEMIQNPESEVVITYNIHHILGRQVCRIITGLALTRCEVFGVHYLKNLPRPYVIVMNHVSHWDPVVMWAWFPDYFNFMVKEELHRIPVFGAMSELSGNIPLKRDGYDIKAIKEALRVVKSGVNLAFFAEGTRSHDGLVMPFKEGAVGLAARMGCPIVPVYIHGTFRVLPKGSFVLRSAPTELHILEPNLLAMDKKLEKTEVEMLTQSLHAQVKDCQSARMSHVSL